jgi:hypothetical protein
MISTELVSITFRGLSPKEIVGLVSRAGLNGIEWGGDVHVPHGNKSAARKALEMSTDSGIATASYGSYYCAGESGNGGLEFDVVLETACELGASVIRVWAGKKEWSDVGENYRDEVIDDLWRIGAMAQCMDKKISLEFHSGTLTGTNESSFELARRLKGANVYFYWQPPVGKKDSYCAEGLSNLLPNITNVHVFHWLLGKGGIERQPLYRGKNSWMKYLEILSSSMNRHFAMIEFVRDESPEQFLKDAAMLKGWSIEAQFAHEGT